MGACSKYMNNKCLSLILYCLKFLNKPNMTLRQLRRFLGITCYCCIWILDYEELAQPLYKLITETSAGGNRQAGLVPRDSKGL